jgi:SepF-like predicted cell division protein (DUF552 family)
MRTLYALACTLAIVLPAVSAPALAQGMTVEEVIAGCRERVGRMGASVVKYCADQDIAAAQAVGGYPDEHDAIIARCIKQVGRMGWSVVRYCVDKDVAAEKELRGYGKR